MDVKQFSNLPGGHQVRGTYLLRSKTIRQATNGSQYLDLILADRQGDTVVGRKWAVSPADGNGCEEGTLVDVAATVNWWKGAVQLKVETLAPCADRAASAFDYLPRTQGNVEQMAAEVEALIAGLQEAHLRQLLGSLFDAERLAAFKTAPAAKEMHHARVGGLLEHALGVARLCGRLADLYQGLNADLLVCGALCHDIGKLAELSPRSFAYTTEGKLLGHTGLGLLLVDQAIAAVPDFPAPLRQQLLHLIATHHGDVQFGALARPATREAWALHLADLTDARLSAIGDTLGALAEDGWARSPMVGDLWKPPSGMGEQASSSGKTLREAVEIGEQYALFSDDGMEGMDRREGRE